MRRISGAERHIKMQLRAGLLALLFIATEVTANAPHISVRPVARVDVYPVALPSFAPRTSLRPMLRPGSARLPGGAIRVTPVTRVATPQPTVITPAITPTPKPQPARKTRADVGRICRDRDLQGIEVGRVPGKLNGCGVRDAVRLYSVSGIALSSPAVMECETAKALKSWVDRGMSRAVRNKGGGVVKLQVAAGYSCRTRNSRPGAKISEHGKGRAIDISAFHLKNGDKISVLKDWGRGKNGRILRKMHKSACGPFGTVLGPESDRYHKDHFHFDIARHRGGSYCR
jgi:hypothetical protein